MPIDPSKVQWTETIDPSKVQWDTGLTMGRAAEVAGGAVAPIAAAAG
jgi:hypothetical protein